jgi:hypothetical protein
MCLCGAQPTSQQSALPFSIDRLAEKTNRLENWNQILLRSYFQTGGPAKDYAGMAGCEKNTEI